MRTKPKAVPSVFWCLAFGLAQQANGELVVAEGLAVGLFATAEQLSNPASIDVDHRGRVWVGEAVNYRKKDRKEGDRILIMEDSDGDGRADKTKVFYQDPDIDGVHGVCVLGNKVIVSAPDRILLLTDVDGDDRADEKKLLFKGKVLRAVKGQHDHAIHAVMFGPDGRLYFNFGNYSAGLWRADGSLVKDAFGNPVDNSRKPFQEGMVIRCEMDGSKVEVLGHNFRNNWEVAVDSFGSMWQSDNDNGSSSCRVNFVMEYGNYGYRDEKTGADYKTNRTNMEATMQRRMWHQNDPGVIPNLLITGRGAPTGMLVYEGNLLPEPFRGQMIHAEPGRNVVWAFPTKQVGAGYQASITNLVHSKGDRNYRPCDVSVAPDGSLIIADWFDPVDCCHRTVNDAGRLFRVAPPKHAYVTPDFDFKTPAGAAKALRNPNLSVRYKAWTALQAMQEKAPPALTKMAADENPRFRARALWALAAIKDGATKAIEKALQDEDNNLRALALRIARRHGLTVEPLVRRLVRDESALVRRECAVSLHRVATPKAAELWAELALQHDGKDRWYLEALGIGEKGNETACLNAWLKKVGDAWKAPAGRDLVWRSRAPEAAGLLAKLVLDPEVPESEHPRFMRALDFHSGKAKEDALATLLLNLDAPATPQKPNVVVLFIDDLGWKDLGVYGSKFFETPRIDRLAKQGALFTRAYSSCNVCSPTRASLLTGKYPQRIGFTSWLNPRKPNGPNSAATHIPATETTIGEAFRQAGYRTGYIGKWHVGSERVGMPKQHGFDWQMATAKHGLPGSYFHPYKRKGLPSADVPDMEDGKSGDYLTDVLTDKGIGFIRETAKEGKKPFFLIFGHYAVHTPIQAPAKLVEKYQAKKQRMYGDTPLKMIPERFNRKVPARQQNPVYAGMMENLDRNVGKVIDALDELGLTKDTIIVFTSDNGGSCMPGTPTKRPTSNYPLRASKGWNYEGGIRIPTFITWPGKIPAMKTDDPVITMDLYPTLLELTGCKQLPKQTLDGRSLVPLIHGKKKTLGRPFLAWWYPHANGHGTQPCQTILKDGWKLVHWMNQNETELYRLDDDVGERNDLSKKEPQKTRELLQTLNQWVKETVRK